MRIIGFAAIARGNVELLVRAEQNHAAIVIPVRLSKLKQDAL